MLKCNDCGKEFSTSQGLGSHRRFGCDSGGIVVRQATEVLKRQTSDLRPQTSDLRPQASKQIRIPDLRPQVSDLRPQVSRPQPLADYRRDVEDLETRLKLRKRERYTQGRNLRVVGIIVVGLGVLIWLAGGGKIKLPFFREVD